MNGPAIIAASPAIAELIPIHDPEIPRCSNNIESSGMLRDKPTPTDVTARIAAIIDNPGDLGSGRDIRSLLA